MTDRSPRTGAPPFSLRLSTDERVRLERDAAGMSLGAYVRWRVFDPSSPPPKSRGKFPVKDHQALSKALGLLGQSRLANNLNQLARAANTGSLPLTPDTDAELQAAARDIAAIREMIVAALGLSTDAKALADTSEER
jgi:hypothetical protein